MRTFDLRIRFNPESGKGRAEVRFGSHTWSCDFDGVSANHLALQGLNHAVWLAGDTPIRIRTSNSYLARGAQRWRHEWRRNGWRRSDDGPLAHVSEWMRLDELMGERDVEVVYAHDMPEDLNWFFADPVSGREPVQSEVA